MILINVKIQLNYIEKITDIYVNFNKDNYLEPNGLNCLYNVIQQQKIAKSSGHSNYNVY